MVGEPELPRRRRGCQPAPEPAGSWRCTVSKLDVRPSAATSGHCLAATLLIAAAACAQPVAPAPPPDEYMAAGDRAMEWTRRFVDLGPRPAGSDALDLQHQMMLDGLRQLSCAVEVDAFVAATPVGALPMRNVIARFGPLDSASVVVVSGHYDTLRRDGFVGANDGGSSAGLLMTLAERLESAEPPAVWVVFFDGEESTTVWRNQDHTYGSRRLAGRWFEDGTATRIRALINVDMIGDRDLELLYEGNSDAALRETAWEIAAELGYRQAFGYRTGYVDDDHIPFLRVGIPSLNLIDFDYGPANSYWHTSEDQLDKLDPRSFATTLHVVEAMVHKLLAAD